MCSIRAIFKGLPRFLVEERGFSLKLNCKAKHLIIAKGWHKYFHARLKRHRGVSSVEAFEIGCNCSTDRISELDMMTWADSNTVCT